jgi:predicted RNA-binding protein with PUA-like domain
MAFWLFKEEPSHYSFAELQRDKRTVWDGVTNNLARQNLRKIKAGDRVFFYHTGNEKAVVGEMKVTKWPKRDTDSTDEKAVVVEVEAVRQLPHPVPLSRIKKDPSLSSWDLVRLSRLSIVPVTEAQWQRVLEMSREET